MAYHSKCRMSLNNLIMGIFGITCMLVLVNYMTGKPVNYLLKKIGRVNWKEKTTDLWDNLKPYAQKVGRTAAKSVLTLYYVLQEGDLSTTEKVMVYAAMLYVVHHGIYSLRVSIM